MIPACWSNPVLRVPLTLPVADKVSVPPSLEVLWGVPKHRRRELTRRMSRWCWICYYVGGGWLGVTPLRSP